jgi:hypothetical protein
MFQHFTWIPNNIKANITILSYNDHNRALKLLHSLDCIVWSAKTEAIMESPSYETLKVDELFCKLKSSKVDRKLNVIYVNPTDPHSLAMISSSWSRSIANPSSK